MDPEVEKSWHLAKESRPEAVVFVRSGGIYFLRGDDVETINKEFGIRCFGNVIGFDPQNRCSLCSSWRNEGAVFFGLSEPV